MKQVNCDVIQDLLPSYSDKISSEATNKLVEEHLKTCEKCKEIFKNMNQDSNIEIVENLDKQIDYLKKYKRKKIETIYIAVMTTIAVIFGIFLFLVYHEFYLNVDNVNLNASKHISSSGEYIQFNLTSNSNNVGIFVKEKNKIQSNTDKKEIYIEICGKYDFLAHGTAKLTRWPVSFDKEELENIERIYLQDLKGNTREIWNREQEMTIIDDRVMDEKFKELEEKIEIYNNQD